MPAPEETLRSRVINFWIPLIFGVVVLIVSLVLDITGICGKEYWMSRSGSIITIIGAMIALHDARESYKVAGRNLYVNTKLPYKWVSLVLVIIGTVLWGYGDLPFK